jgi:hypothetical protein
MGPAHLRVHTVIKHSSSFARRHHGTRFAVLRAVEAFSLHRPVTSCLGSPSCRGPPHFSDAARHSITRSDSDLAHDFSSSVLGAVLSHGSQLLSQRSPVGVVVEHLNVPIVWARFRGRASEPVSCLFRHAAGIACQPRRRSAGTPCRTVVGCPLGCMPPGVWPRSGTDQCCPLTRRLQPGAET